MKPFKTYFFTPHRLHLWLVITCFALAYRECYAQTKIKLVQTKQLSFNKKQGFQKFSGNVIFKQHETTIYCDSAHYYSDRNVVDAFGNVKIEEGDSIVVTGKHLNYDGNTKKAKLRQKVVFVKLGTATLYTEHLDYDRPRNFAYYFNGGRLIDSVNVLTSNKGYYDANSNIASFKRNVNVRTPEYTMTSDSMQYNSRTKVIYFRTRTHVVNQEGSTFVYEEGEYATQTKRSVYDRGTVDSRDYTIKGRNYRTDDIRKLYKIRDSVVMAFKEEALTIYAQNVDYSQHNGKTKAYNNAWLAKVTATDTLFISADTLVSIDSTDPTKKRLLAYHNVKIFKSDMQGVADSMEYRVTDSTIYFYRSPVLWAKENQMTADSISMLIENNTVNKIFLTRNAFVISQDTLTNFNQIKGRNMVAEFAHRQIDKVLVQGNGESIYFALSEEKPVSTIGMNKILCSNIIIRFRDGQVNNLSFYIKPEAQFIPPHELKDGDKKLKDFSWQLQRRPFRKDVVRSKIPRTYDKKGL